MSRLLYCVAWSLLLASGQGSEPLFSLHDEFEAALRGQSPDSGPALSNPTLPSGPTYSGPYPPAAPQDPFLVPQPYQPGPPPPLGPLYGSNSPLPYRYGWTPEFDMAYLPSAHTSPNFGNFSDFEFDMDLVYSMPLGPDLIFTATPQFNYRYWDASTSFTRSLYHYGIDLQLRTPPAAGPIGYQLGFNPSLNTDFQSEFASESINLDANGAILFQWDPAWTGVLGVVYYDRVENIVLPSVGVVYRPDDCWEFRILFPQGRISRYVGDFWWGSHWLYMAWEYHVDSFQVSTPPTNRNQIQYEDYRLTFGLRSDHRGFTKYIEAGWVFGRNVDYKRLVPGFDVSDGFIVRGGIRF